MPFRRVPLAWANLVHNKVKLAASLAGITFAVALMFMEMGFYNALLDGMVGLLRKFDADLILTSRTRYTIGFKESFSRRHLNEALQFQDVLAANPIYIETRMARWRVLDSGLQIPVRVVAFRLADEAFTDQEIQAQTAALQVPNSALFDRSGKARFYGRPRIGDVTELSDRRLHVVGEFGLGADFLNDGNLVMSDRNFLNYFADRRGADPESLPIDIGLIKVRPGTTDRVRASLAKALPPSVEVFTKDQFIDNEKQFWLLNTPVGFVFWLGMVFGFVVGVVICYQILFSEISSCIREYATLLAIGYRRVDLVQVVLLEALYLAVMGFVAGTAVSFVCYAANQKFTCIPFILSTSRVTLMFAFTLLMCLISACLAIRKLWSAAPADLF
ncbi:MAG: ABC transporter permease DevC [Isosphaeraceae bacterium]|jgi:putative ABC transport system permease protein